MQNDVLGEPATLDLLSTGTTWPEAFTQEPILQPIDFHWPFQDGGIFGLPNADYLNSSGIGYIDPLRDDYSLDHSHGSLDDVQPVRTSGVSAFEAMK